MPDLMPDFFTTERLFLRCYTPEDDTLLLEISQRNHDHWQRFESGNVLFAINDLSNAKKIARLLSEEWMTQHSFFVAAFEKMSGSYVGQIYIGPQDPGMVEFEVGYVADINQEGRGYISEALSAVLRFLFNQTNTQCVTIHCSDKNPRSAHVAERCGFKLRQGIPNDTAPVGVTLTYSLTKKDYEESQFN